MNGQHRLTEGMSAATARLQVDVHGGEPRAHVLEDLDFLDHRLGHVQISPEVTLSTSDIVWNQEGERAIACRTSSSSTSCLPPVGRCRSSISETNRKRPTAFVTPFTDHPYYFVRATTPQVLLDQVDELL